MGKKSKTYRNAAEWHFLCETFVTNIQKRYEAVEYGAFLIILKIDLFMIKKTKPRFFEFGFSAITLLLIILLIHVAYFLNRLFNAHLSTYQTAPSSIFDFLSFGTAKNMQQRTP